MFFDFSLITLSCHSYSKKKAEIILVVRVRVFDATFNNISVISWRAVLFVKYPEKTTDICKSLT